MPNMTRARIRNTSVVSMLFLYIGKYQKNREYSRFTKDVLGSLSN